MKPYETRNMSFQTVPIIGPAGTFPLFLVPFLGAHDQKIYETTSDRDRPLRATWAQRLWLTWPAAAIRDPGRYL